ncbi:DNA ligase N terminus/ATP dependent DNA ligase domain/ATP dependent DNA ligase C terminal region containing protein, putative [Angomonas deanei]|uniref:DNA ligase n=1 Tax=Angomonas deanei TaxID=59799 RepID=A0A7G2CFW1_9TRYP|nr:DNA ligase N terminus/ATP dependent DNA ligase domain/ATP dependent DNA ligase C terminal region containing protein, putative [Angomonas deanei]
MKSFFPKKTEKHEREEGTSSEAVVTTRKKKEPSKYFSDHKEEFYQILGTIPKPSISSMANLLNGAFDPHTFSPTLWPPVSGPDHVSFSVVADILADISATSSRLECIKILTNLLLAVLERCPEELASTFYLVVNKQAPQHEGVELGIGDAILINVVAECCGMTAARVKEVYQQCGDLAEVAQNKKQQQSTLVKPKALGARDVFRAFREIALMSGKDVVRRRSDTIKKLLRDAKGAEINIIVRALQQKMRIGMAESSALNALGYAFTLSFLGSESGSMPTDDLQKALSIGATSVTRLFAEVPDIEVVIKSVVQHGYMLLVPGSRMNLEHKALLSIRPGLPVKPQLAHPTSGISVVLDRFQGKSFTSEYKYDGERAQIHFDNGKFHIFSRNSETHTGKYPDVISFLPQAFDHAKVTSFILDSEVVAVDETTGKLQAFQVLQHRGRKNISESDVKIPVCVFAFDLLFLNGESLLERTLKQRREVLYSTFTPVQSKLAFASYLDTDNVEDIQKFLEQSIADGCEGLMIKTLEEDAFYTPSKRSRHWLKLKKDYMDGVTDTLDLVPLGGFYGKGKRTGVFGGFLLGCYDPEGDEYQSICKIGTGFQDEELESLTRLLSDSIVGEKPGYYRADDAGVDVWFKECQVWEVKAADLSVSPVHFAAIGIVDQSKGVALRFPRFIRVREDKGPSDATTAQQVAEMYRAQSLAIQPEENEEEGV